MLDRLSSDLFVYWLGVKCPIIKDRDFVIAEWNFKKSDGNHVMSFVSVKHPQCGEQKKYVRAEILMGAWLIERSPKHANVCRVTHVTGVDPMGELPSIVKKSGATASADAVITLKRLAEDAAKQEAKLEQNSH